MRLDRLNAKLKELYAVVLLPPPTLECESIEEVELLQDTFVQSALSLADGRVSSSYQERVGYSIQALVTLEFNFKLFSPLVKTAVAHYYRCVRAWAEVFQEAQIQAIPIPKLDSKLTKRQLF